MAPTGAIVLAGGRSRRMGTAKAGLEWHGSTLLRRTAGLLARGVDGPLVVVRAPGQRLPDLPSSVRVVDDPVEGAGPLQGIAVGLAALREEVEHAFVCSTDLPHLHPAFVRAVARAAQDVDVALPVVRGYRQPLAACYRTSLAGRAAELLAAGRGRPAFLLEQARVRLLDEAALLADARVARLDPHLLSVDGVNDPQAYDAARARPAPSVVVQRLGVLATGPAGRETSYRAACLGDLAAQAGIGLDRHVLAAVNGDHTGRDPELPLAEGDVVAFMSAAAGG